MRHQVLNESKSKVPSQDLWSDFRAFVVSLFFPSFSISILWRVKNITQLNRSTWMKGENHLFSSPFLGSHATDSSFAQFHVF